MLGGRQLRETLKRVVFGPQNFPQQFSLGMRDPQPEVIVHLCGMGEPRDVTDRHMMACGLPFTIGIGFDGEIRDDMKQSRDLLLRFQERNGHGRLLGEIALRPGTSIPAGDKTLCLFQPRSYLNCCLPKPWLWSRYLYYSRSRGDPQTHEMALTALESRSMFVFYICPRPVVLASVAEGNAGNVFPMNLMGPIGDGYFSFSLNKARPVTSLVARVGRIALSSIPAEQSPVAVGLGKNHRNEHIDLKELPFTTKASPTLEVPVPVFALRVREMQIESARDIGSHTLFIARTIHDERWQDGLEFFVVHGIYEAYRQRVQRVSA